MNAPLVARILSILGVASAGTKRNRLAKAKKKARAIKRNQRHQRRIVQRARNRRAPYAGWLQVR